MRTKYLMEGHTIILEGSVEKPTAEDMERVQKIREDLKAKHADEGGLIAHRSSKASGYKRLTIEWRSKPELAPNG